MMKEGSRQGSNVLCKFLRARKRAVERFETDSTSVLGHFIVNGLAILGASPRSFAVRSGFDLRRGGILPVRGHALQCLEFRSAEFRGIKFPGQRDETALRVAFMVNLH